MSLYYRKLIKTAPPFIGILDLYPADMAVSLRKLRTGADTCLRVRRATDSLEMDIGFAFNPYWGAWWVDLAAIVDFIGTAGMHVPIIYDQSGNGHHWFQTIANSQPMMVDGATPDHLGGAIFERNTSPGQSRPVIKQVDSTKFYSNAWRDMLRNTNGCGAYYCMAPSSNSSTSCSMLNVYDNLGGARLHILSGGTTDAQAMQILARANDGSTQRSAFTAPTARRFRQRLALVNVPGNLIQTYDSGILSNQSTAAFTGTKFPDTPSNADPVLMSGGNRAAVFGELILYRGTAHEANKAAIMADQIAAWGV